MMFVDPLTGGRCLLYIGRTEWDKIQTGNQFQFQELFEIVWHLGSDLQPIFDRFAMFAIVGQNRAGFQGNNVLTQTFQIFDIQQAVCLMRERLWPHLGFHPCLIIWIIALEQQCAHIFGSKDIFYVCVNISNVGHTTSDSSMFDEREAGDRWDNPGQAAVYWALYSPVYSAVYCCILEPPLPPRCGNLTQYFCQNSLYNLYHSIHLEPQRWTFTSWIYGRRCIIKFD